MKVILIEDVQDVGRKYEIKEVKDGHARNFLIPQKLAKPATKENVKWLQEKRGELEKVAEEDLKKAQEIASKIDDMEVAMNVKMGDKGELFEAITAAKIADQLKAMGYEVKKTQVLLEKPIKEAGEFPVKINLAHNLESEIRVIVTGEGDTNEEEE